MRVFWKILLLVLLVAMAGPFFIKGPDGKPLMNGGDVKRIYQRNIASAKRTWRSFANKAQHATGDDDAGKTTVHKWQDADGQWHYSDEAPENSNSQTVIVDPNVNVIEAVPVSKPDPAIRATPEGDNTGAIEQPQLPIPTPGRIKDALQKTRDAKQQVEERNSAQQEQLDDL